MLFNTKKRRAATAAATAQRELNQLIAQREHEMIEDANLDYIADLHAAGIDAHYEYASGLVVIDDKA